MIIKENIQIQITTNGQFMTVPILMDVCQECGSVVSSVSVWKHDNHCPAKIFITKEVI